MTKTIAQAIRETREKLIETLNASGLPIDVMDMLVGEIKIVIHNQAEAEYQTEQAKAKDEDKRSD